MQPGLPRATVGGIIGFLVGILFVTGLRLLFGFTPAWNPGLSLVMGVFLTTFGVVWGIGGFKPEMSAHPDDNAPVLSIEEQAEAAGPWGVLTNTMWQLIFLMVVMMVIGIVVALIPGVGLNVTSDVDASVKGLGSQTLTLFGEEFVVNQAFMLLGFILFAVVSLAIATGITAWIFIGLNNGIITAKQEEAPAPDAPRENVNPLMRRAGDIAGQLAERIAPPEDKESTSLVAKEES